MVSLRWWAPLLAASTLVRPLAAQGAPVGDAAGAATPASDAAPADAAALRATRLVGRITVDGRLDEAAWLLATPVTSFTQLDPHEGAPVSQRTTVRILFGEDAVHVAAMLHDTQPVSLRLARRDASFGDSDVFAVAFDSHHDHQTAYRFAINASGVKRDEIVSATGGGDASWDPVWEGVTTVTDSGWTAELRIPYSQLRFRQGADQTWGFQLERRIARTQEHAVHAFTPKRQRGGPPRYAHIEGIGARADANRLELLPYVVARADRRPVPRNPDVAFANPYLRTANYGTGIGGDLKLRLTSNFTMDATVNPDFGQVEADPAQINLSAYETRLAERRPFFVEGAEIFRFGSSLNRANQIVYSRRVGRTPQGGPPGTAAYADVPESATILGAAKLTGRTAGGWSVGFLEAVTARETVPYVDAARDEHRAAVEPATSYFAGRARRSSASGGTSGGAILTAVNRRLEDATLTAQLRSAAYVAGADFRQEWGNRDYAFAAEVTSSVVQGTAPAIARTQRSSARYFQRPDAPHLEVDTTATALAGHAAFVAVGKFAGDWQRNLRLFTTSAGYEINDLGFQTAADRRGFASEISYRQNTPGRVLRRWEVATDPDATWNHAGDRVGGSIGVRANATLLNYWHGMASWNLVPAGDDDRLTRGGPLARRPADHSLSGYASTNPRLPLVLSVSGRQGWNAAGGRGSRGEASLTWKPAANVELRAGPELDRGRTVAQYVAAIGDPTATATFGRRYVFASLDQTTLSLPVRANVAFSPTLTFESYLEPFVSSGDYGPMKELRAPRTFAFTTYGEEAGTMTRDEDGVYAIDPDGEGPAASFRLRDRDYSYRSLRGSAVLRWEWHRGSTLYLVWQQQRAMNRVATGEHAQDERIGRFDPYREGRGLFGIVPQNVLQLKVSYWLNP